MLISNTMRYGTDEFAFSKQALLVSKTALDTAGQTSIERLVVTGVQPAGSTRAFMFTVDDKTYTFANGSPVEYAGTVNFDNVIANGNTADEVNAATDLSSWLGKKIYPIIALEAPVDMSVMPTAKVAVVVKSNTEIFERTVDTAEIELGAAESKPQLIDVKAETTTTGNGFVEVQVRLKTDGVWGSYTALTAVENAPAEAVQFRARYVVTKTDGTDSAKVNKITMRYVSGSSKVSGDVAELYSVVQDFKADLSTAILSIRHKPLKDSVLEAYVSFLPSTKRREIIPIGTATGVVEQFVLGVDGVRDVGIVPSSIQIFANGQLVANFGYNTEVSEITLAATAGAAITATYDYNHQPEKWLEMTRDIDQQIYSDGTVQTRFSYALDDDLDAGLTVANVRVKMSRLTGHVDEEILGTGAGNVQMFVLKHAAKEETIDCNADWSYDAANQIIKCVAPKGQQITVSYDWLGEQQILHSWTAGYTAAL